MPVSLDRYNSIDTNGDESVNGDANDGTSFSFPQTPSGSRPPPRRVSFSRSVRPCRSKLGGDTTPSGTPSLGGAGIPLGDRIQSIPESIGRMSIAVPTALSQPEATPLPMVSMTVLGIAMMGEFLTANVSAPWILLMVESFGVEAADVGLWTGILVSSFFITQFATSLLWASLAERYGRRLILFTSLVGSGVTCVAFGASKSLAFAFALRLLQGAFGGAVGVARGSVASISDSTNEAQAYAILGFCWGFGGVGGAVIGGTFVNPAQKWTIFESISLFVEFPYILPTMVASSITITGGLMALTLNRDAGPRIGASSSGLTEPSNSTVIAEAGLTNSATESRGVPIPSLPVPSTCRTTENTPLRPATGFESYGSVEPSAAICEQTEPRLGVPLGERTWTQSSAVSGGSGYGDTYRSRFGVGVRHRASWVSAITRRPMGVGEGFGEMYADITTEEREPHLVERIMIANELTVTSIGDLWVASALTMDTEEDEDLNDPNSRLTLDQNMEGALEAQHGSAISESTVRATSIEPPARSVSACQRTTRSSSGIPYRINQPYSFTTSLNNGINRVVSYPAILQNTGLRSPSPAFDFASEVPEMNGGTNVDVLQPIFEGKPVGFEAQEVEAHNVSVFSQLPLTMIFQYGLLAMHSTTHDQVFMSYLVSKYGSGGLELNSGDFAQLIAMMCFAQIVFQFYVYPMMGPPLGRFSHLSMFRIGGLLMAVSYLSVILVRPLAESGANGTAILGGESRFGFSQYEKDDVWAPLLALSLPTAVRYCGITFSYTAATVLLNYMSPPHAIGMANGLAQSVVSLSRFVGPILGGYLWSFSTHADPEGFAFGFWFCAAFSVLAVIHSLTLH